MQAVPINGEKWLICGGRTFFDATMFDAAMSDIVSMFGMPSRIIHGAASGADSLAGSWARRHALDEIAMPADWDKHGKAAGPIRNEAIITLKPHRVIAFPGGKGTADMISRAKNAGVEVIEIRSKE